MNKLTFSLLIMLLFSVAVICGSINEISRLRDEKRRIQQNQLALLSDVKYYKTKDSLNAISVSQLNLRINEFRRSFAELNNRISNLKIKLNRVESISSHNILSGYKITAPLNTTLSLTGITSQTITYKTPYININGTIENKTFRGDIETYDTIVQIIHRVPRKFLFLRWGTKALKQEVVSVNPHTKIEYSRYITIQK